jgi:3-carboxy-cis,cis-muconate cycloisomerase
MPTTLDCLLFRDLFGSAEIRAIFDSRALLQGWLDAEAALAEAEAELGLIPAGAAEAIRGVAVAERFDLDALREGLADSQHPLVPAIRALAEAAGDGGSHVHLGATTQDIMDTGMVLQVRRALDVIESDLAGILRALSEMVDRERSTPMAGRTHGQHAVPITLGLKAGVWLAELTRTLDRLLACRPRVLVAQLGGAAGTLAALGEPGPAVRAALCRRLSLGEPPTPWFTARDGFAELVSVLGLLAATVEKVSLEILRLQKTEVAELAEPATEGHVGSSTMPQKRNPMVCEYIAATCKLIRGLTPVMQGAMVAEHERDMSAWAVEWLLIPQSLIMTGGALGMFRSVVSGLEVDGDRMARNLEMTKGAILAERVMIALAAHMGRERAHSLMMSVTREAEERDVELLTVLEERGDVTSLVTHGELKAMLDPATYLGEADRVAEAALAETRRLLGEEGTAQGTALVE